MLRQKSGPGFSVYGHNVPGQVERNAQWQGVCTDPQTQILTDISGHGNIRRQPRFNTIVEQQVGDIHPPISFSPVLPVETHVDMVQGQILVIIHQPGVLQVTDAADAVAVLPGPAAPQFSIEPACQGQEGVGGQFTLECCQHQFPGRRLPQGLGQLLILAHFQFERGLHLTINEFTARIVEAGLHFSRQFIPKHLQAPIDGNHF